MAFDEALLVFNIPKADMTSATAAAVKTRVEEKYARMFTANDAAAGGSFYLQSKIFRAKESFDAELEEMAKMAREK